MPDAGNPLHASQRDVADGIALAPLPKRKAFLTPHSHARVGELLPVNSPLRSIHFFMLQRLRLGSLASVDRKHVFNVSLRVMDWLISITIAAVVSSATCGCSPREVARDHHGWESPLTWSDAVVWGATGVGALPRVVRRKSDGKLMELIDWSSGLGSIAESSSGVVGEVVHATETDPMYVDINPIRNGDVLKFVLLTGYKLESESRGAGLSVSSHGVYEDAAAWERWRPQESDDDGFWTLRPVQLLTDADLAAMAKWIGGGVEPPAGARRGARVQQFRFRRPINRESAAR